MKKAVLVALAAVTLFSGSAAASVISLVGDIDCFGLGGSCPDGSKWQTGLGSDFLVSNQGAGDPWFTDMWETPGSVSYVHSYLAPAAATSAELDIRIAGIHDIYRSTRYTIFFDGTSVGTIAPHSGRNAYQEVLTYQFSIPLGLLTGNDTVSWSGTGGDGYIIDYSQLTIEAPAGTSETPAGTSQPLTNPEPTSLLLLGTGIVGAGARRWRKLRADRRLPESAA